MVDLNELLKTIRYRDFQGSSSVESYFSLIHRHSEGKLNLNPPFQRDVVWSNQKKSRLIESIIYRIPIPNITLLRNFDENNDYEEIMVVDGKQRINSVLAFLGLLTEKDEDFKNNKFSLTGCKDKNLNGLTIADFKRGKGQPFSFNNQPIAIVTIDTFVSKEEAYAIGAKKFLELIDLGEPIETAHLTKVRNMSFNN